MAHLSCLEPACGGGHMAKVLKEYFANVRASDAYDYGYGEVRDFLADPYPPNSVDWVITNPPFRLAEAFIQQALIVARRGVAVLVRTAFIEGVGRHKRLFRDNSPAKLAAFSERVPMLKGRLDRKATTATSYAWFVWEKDCRGSRLQTIHVPPCRKALERDSDYACGPATGGRDAAEEAPASDRARSRSVQLSLF